jgi:hypothetical protein
MSRSVSDSARVEIDAMCAPIGGSPALAATDTQIHRASADLRLSAAGQYDRAREQTIRCAGSAVPATCGRFRACAPLEPTRATITSRPRWTGGNRVFRQTEAEARSGHDGGIGVPVLPPAQARLERIASRADCRSA